jgi:uncharacterized protein (DUF1330 family)
MPAYLIVNYEVEDPKLYGEYAKAAGPAMKIGRQTVVLQFDSKEKARELYESGAYQAVIGKRLDATSKHFAILVQGLPPR